MSVSKKCCQPSAFYLNEAIRKELRMYQIGTNLFNLSANILPLKCLGTCRVWVRVSLTHPEPSKGEIQPHSGIRCAYRGRHKAGAVSCKQIFGCGWCSFSPKGLIVSRLLTLFPCTSTFFVLRLVLDDDVVIGGGGCKAYARPVRSGQRTAKRSCRRLCHDL